MNVLEGKKTFEEAKYEREEDNQAVEIYQNQRQNNLENESESLVQSTP